jgi:hypothetical protein
MDVENTVPGAEACRRRYRELAAECLERGFDEVALSTTLSEMTAEKNGLLFLRPLAYSPTGIALGAPLPESRLTAALWAASERIARHVRLQDGAVAFAFVPPEAYHVTIANCSHFEDGGRAVLMSSDVHVQVVTALHTLEWEPIVLEFDGLIITRQGRLILTGVPVNAQLARMREFVASRFPEFRMIPTTAHLKLGHLLAEPTDFNRLLNMVSVEGSAFAGVTISFDNLYTPVERIEL